MKNSVFLGDIAAVLVTAIVAFGLVGGLIAAVSIAIRIPQGWRAEGNLIRRAFLRAVRGTAWFVLGAIIISLLPPH